MQLALSYTDLAVPAPKIQRRQFQIFLGVACVYFFVNSFMLPGGFLYTILLTPFFMLWAMRHRLPMAKYSFVFLACWSVVFIIHYSLGISLPDYVKSSALYFTAFVFAATLYTYFRLYSFTYEPLMERILQLNFLFVIVAVFLLATDKKEWLWNIADISEGVADFPRLQMLTYEPSYYSLLLIPSFLFYFQYVFYRNMHQRKWLFLLTILISLGLSVSYGAIFISILTLGIFICYNSLTGVRKSQNKRFIFLLVLSIVTAVSVMMVVFSDSGFVRRIMNILGGNDSSTNNRSVMAYLLALKIADMKSLFFGVGPGQIKILGQDLISLAYSYATDEATGKIDIARIPCSMAETLAIFGYLGFFLKIAIECILFKKTKVKTSSFRLCLFIFMFIYQFVGSFSTSVAEIFIWVLAFSRVFQDSYFKKQVAPVPSSR